MKLSLKGFFLHEALGDEGSRSARGSVRQISLQQLAQLEPDAEYEIRQMTEDPNFDISQVRVYQAADKFILSHPQHPGDDLYWRAGGDGWETGETAANPLRNEHQDPTAVVDAGSTIWSDPEQPVDVKKFSSSGGNLHIELQEMFGLSEMGGPGSGRGRPKGSLNKTQDQIDAEFAAKAARVPGKRGRPVGWRKSGTVTPPPSAPPEELPDEMPAGFDEPVPSDPGDPKNTEFGEYKPSGSSDGKLPPATPEDDEDIDWTDRSGIDDDSWLDDPALGAGAVAPPQLPKDPSFKKPPRTANPGEVPVQPYSGPEKFDFSPPTERDPFWTDVEAEDAETLSWDELKATEPEVAADIEQAIPDVIEPGFSQDDESLPLRLRNLIFTRNSAGDLIMRSAAGRKKWDAEKKEFIPMDDGGTPAGEF